jgi:hypothetical protein
MGLTILAHSLLLVARGAPFCWPVGRLAAWQMPLRAGSNCPEQLCEAAVKDAKAGEHMHAIAF